MDQFPKYLCKINNKGIITQVNGNAEKIVSNLGQEIIGQQIESVFGQQPLIQSVLQSGESLDDVDIDITYAHQKLKLTSIYSMSNKFGQNFGCLLAIRKHSGRNVSHTVMSETKFMFDKIIGSSEPMVNSVKLAQKFAKFDAHFLLQGENGTGKEVFAKLSIIKADQMALLLPSIVEQSQEP
ncbi:MULTISPECIES: sigma 54-interacting transcriptional regulator [Dehalobacter]|jgi:transcriptional regulator with PAS, ATPase and Fis domain|uniref:Sigma-54 factor interaction domain-containing protein n=1 Tax=Dehalobacter restrictus (strain DSM 9455 / PER-K23) TaxID=871738 RepID=A0ABN4C1I8_DEHRP|nr:MULTISPECIES: sigma 54-interacting transcriptional regulator [Dehalobacter]AHF11221.1 hypothetical protein DEHRE_01840 [Dehalobacter restrictus DSM 9455]OCZ53679.1 hypothetical protein A7D23_06845 [Dehalobacter sp. TeCB1]